MELLTRILNVLRLSPQVLAGLFVASSLVLFLPHAVLETLRVDQLRKSYGDVFQVVWLISSCLLLIKPAFWVWKRHNIAITRRLRTQQVEQKLSQLDRDEQAVLREFYLQNRNSIELPIDHPVVVGLIESGVIERIGEFGDPSIVGILCTVELSDAVKKRRLTWRHLGFSSENPPEEELKRLSRTRPTFIKPIIERRALREDRLF